MAIPADPYRNLGPAIRRCECDARDPGATIYHGGNPDGCPRKAADHGDVVASPALCMACLFGCAE